MRRALGSASGRCGAALLFVLVANVAKAAAAAPTDAPLPAQSDIPAEFAPAPPTEEFGRRTEMIAMRDGARLHTVILLPRGVSHAAIVLDRLPYSAERYTRLSPSGQLAATLSPLHADLVRAGYIVVLQDVRGKFGSEGAYVLTRPPVGPYNATAVDHTTDAYDTIEWLVRNVPECNGRVAALGVSYGGFTALMAARAPHPALKAVVPIDPMVDGWTGDDWFRNGAFRQTSLEYLYVQTTTRNSELRWPDTRYDAFAAWLEAGSAQAMARRTGMADLPAYRRMAEHPVYDDFWRSQAVDRMFAGAAPPVPMLLVHSQWDQDDIRGALALYEAVAQYDPSHGRVFLAIGPWSHAESVLGDGMTLGPLNFGARTAQWFRDHVLLPFLARTLREDSRVTLAPVTAFETGTNRWREYERWPQSCERGCPHSSQRLYLRGGRGLAFAPPTLAEPPASDYVADPASPVPFRARPVRANHAPGSTYAQWLTDDQRFASDRPDVLTFRSAPLTQAVALAGTPVVTLLASTTGSDADWVVKLIDQYPDEVASDPPLGGYQLPLAMTVMRARYRDDPAHPTAVPTGRAIPYAIPLPAVHHVLAPGHRLVLQVQSSWFPLYDRNPQTFVPNIFDAAPADFRAARQRVFHGPRAASFIDLPVVP